MPRVRLSISSRRDVGPTRQAETLDVVGHLLARLEDHDLGLCSLEGREVLDHVTDVMERRPSLLREEPRDARLLVRRLDQFETLSPLTEERHAHALVRKLAHGLGA